MNSLIDIIMLALILSILIMLGSSQLRFSVRVIAAQGIVLGTLPALTHSGGMFIATLFLSIITITIKGVIFPSLLSRALEDTGIQREINPFIGHGSSLLIGFLSLAISAWLCTRLPLFENPGPELAAPAAFFMIFTGLFMIVSRRKAISQVLGYLVLENGMYVFGVVLLREIPLLVELGVLLDAFAAVFVMGIAVYHIHQEFEHTNVDQLDRLKG